MVVDRRQVDHLDRVFQALADATRRDIVERVARGELSVSKLAQGYLMSFAAVQKHVAVLERAGLVTKERRGREQIVHGNMDGVRKATELLGHYEHIWRQRSQRMDHILTEDRKE
ncbi:MAG: transcriptional regulator, ArsR family [Homoserinimonas sp.]|jgi:DNA-binding transcriptional ArsR family regulator|nr:transcriptional regulator, ArsR family [Homoserinimonas sp.]